MRRQAFFLSILSMHPSLTRADYELLAQVSHNTAARDLADLLARGLIVRLGNSSSCRYCLPDTPSESLMPLQITAPGDPSAALSLPHVDPNPTQARTN
jgi:hypothetical protein